MIQYQYMVQVRYTTVGGVNDGEVSEWDDYDGPHDEFHIAEDQFDLWERKRAEFVIPVAKGADLEAVANRLKANDLTEYRIVKREVGNWEPVEEHWQERFRDESH